MPWNEQSGGGDSEGRSPWGQQGQKKPDNGAQRPWGQKPRQDERGPDLEEMMRRLQNRVRRPGSPGGASLGPTGAMVLGALVVAAWFGSGVYVVDAGEQAVVTRFGKFERQMGPGLHVHLPAPIESHRIETVTKLRETPVGGANEAANLILTGDKAIVDVDFLVYWNLSDVRSFVFNIDNPEATVRRVAESAMREVIGQRDFDDILPNRPQIEEETRSRVQEALNAYQAGVDVAQVQLQNVRPPAAVEDAFNDVLKAGRDAQTEINQAQQYRNEVEPKARGEAQQLLQEAEAYREATVREATGEASRFSQLYEQYRRAPRVTRERLYLETMERVYGDADKIIVDSRAGVAPYLPLDQLRKRSTTEGQ